MNVENLKVLQLGKFYPIRGGVEKVAFDLMKGLSERGIECHMLCAAEEGEDRIILLNEHAQLICTHTWVKACATMISPSMIFTLRKICGKYDIIHVHHPDPMACLALFLSGYKGKGYFARRFLGGDAGASVCRKISRAGESAAAFKNFPC